MTGRRAIAAAALLLGALLAGGRAGAFEVAVVPTTGEAPAERLAAYDARAAAALLAQGHTVHGATETGAIMKKLALAGVESLKEAELVGAKIKSQFVVAAVVTALAGQDSIEMRAYYLPEGRSELLEEVAGEGEEDIVVEGMLSRLVTKGGLLTAGKKKKEGAAPPPPPKEPAPAPVEPPPAEATPQPPAAVPSEAGTACEEKKEEAEKKTVQDLQPWPAKKQRPLFGADYRIALELTAAATALLTKPVSGGRAGGGVMVGAGYDFLPACGCEAGGELRVFFGSGEGLSIAPYIGFKFGLSPKVPVFAGMRVSLGYFKGISGAKRNQLFLRGEASLTFVFVARYMLILSPLSISLLAFGGKTISFYDGGLGFGVRF